MSRLKRLAKLRQFVKGMDVQEYLLTQYRQNLLAIEASLNISGKSSAVASGANFVTGGSSGIFSTTSLTAVDVGAASVNITTSGGPVMVGLTPSQLGNCYIASVTAGAFTSSSFYIARDNVIVGQFDLFQSSTGSTATSIRVPVSSISFHDTNLPAGTYNYKLQASSANGQALVRFAKIFAHEIL